VFVLSQKKGIKKWRKAGEREREKKDMISSWVDCVSGRNENRQNGKQQTRTKEEKKENKYTER
jgi:hypothetical protein